MFDIGPFKFWLRVFFVSSRLLTLMLIVLLLFFQVVDAVISAFLLLALYDLLVSMYLKTVQNET